MALGTERHFGRAAQSLFISQPALSRQIRDLERQLETQLIVRSTRAVELTEAGNVLFVHAQRIMKQLEDAIGAVKRAGEGLSGQVRVGFISAVANTILADFVARFRREYPDVQLLLRVYLQPDLLRDLTHGDVDVGFLRSPLSDSELAYETLVTEPYGVVLPEDHPLAGTELISLGDLARESFIMPPRHHNAEQYDTVIAACRAHGFTPPIVHESSITVTLALVAAGVGVSLTGYSNRILQRRGIIVRQLDELTVDTAVAWFAGRPLMPTVGRVIEVAKAVAGRR